MTSNVREEMTDVLMSTLYVTWKWLKVRSQFRQAGQPDPPHFPKAVVIASPLGQSAISWTVSRVSRISRFVVALQFDANPGWFLYIIFTKSMQSAAQVAQGVIETWF